MDSGVEFIRCAWSGSDTQNLEVRCQDLPDNGDKTTAVPLTLLLSNNFTDSFHPAPQKPR